MVLRLRTSHLGVSWVRSYAASLLMRSGHKAPGGGQSRGTTGGHPEMRWLANVRASLGAARWCRLGACWASARWMSAICGDWRGFKNVWSSLSCTSRLPSRRHTPLMRSEARGGRRRGPTIRTPTPDGRPPPPRSSGESDAERLHGAPRAACGRRQRGPRTKLVSWINGYLAECRAVLASDRPGRIQFQFTLIPRCLTGRHF